MDNQQNPVEFKEETCILFLKTEPSEKKVHITIINQLGQTVERMQLIAGKHRIDLSALPEGQYSVRLQAGENVVVKKINIQHSIIN